MRNLNKEKESECPHRPSSVMRYKQELTNEAEKIEDQKNKIEDKAIKDNLTTEGKSYCNQNCRT